MLRTAIIYSTAAFAEIVGCFAFWAWLRHDRPAYLAALGLVALAAFAWLLTLVETTAAGRAFAAYGGVYIAASLLWLVVVERVPLDRWDLGGAALCLAGAAMILAAPR
jgi:small multidrug resistance family-3 protein